MFAFRERQERLSVTPPGGPGVQCLGQTVSGVVADRLQQPVPGLAPGRVGDHQRLAGQLVHQVKRGGIVTAAAHLRRLRAAAYAAQSGNHYVQQDATRWLVVTFWELPAPVDVAIGRAELLLEAASGDRWAEAAILQPLSLLYAYVGCFDDARAAMAQYQAMFSGPLDMAQNATAAGEIELIAGNLAAAELVLAQGCQALRAMGERGFLSTELALLAEALYMQGRLDEAQQLTEEAEVAAAPDDVYTQGYWRAVRAKLLARRGQFAAARQLASDAVALVAATSYAALQAQMLLASAEVSELAGAPDDAGASLRQALRIYEDGRAVALAERVRAALADLAARSGSEPA